MMRARAATSRRSTTRRCVPSRAHERRRDALPAPLVWTFDGPFERCLADLEDTLRRALVMVGDVSRVALLIDLSLPALQQRVEAGDALQPAWGHFLERIAALRPAGRAARAPPARRRAAGDAGHRLSELS